MTLQEQKEEFLVRLLRRGGALSGVLWDAEGWYFQAFKALVEDLRGEGLVEIDAPICNSFAVEVWLTRRGRAVATAVDMARQ